jgi:hypothetical protein
MSNNLNDNRKRKNFLSIFYPILRSNQLIYAYMASSLVWFLSCSTLVKSSWAGDDWPNSQTPYWVKWRYGSLNAKQVLHEALFWNQQWMDGAGRFYPLHWIESRFIFSYLKEIWQYKIFQGVSLLLVGILATYVVYLFSQSHSLSIIFFMTLSVTMQFRRDFDPHLAFASMVPSMLIKYFLAVILIFKSARQTSEFNKLILSVIACVIYFASMSTYEFSFLLFPALVLSLFIGKKSGSKIHLTEMKIQLLDYRVFMLFGTWFLYLILVFGYLRPKALDISGSYELGLSLASLHVFLSQALVGIPGVTFRTRDFSSTSTSLTALVLIALVSYFAARSLLFALASLNLDSGKRLRKNLRNRHSEKANIDLAPESKTNTVLIVFFALIFVLGPGLMMSFQPAWWSRANLGHSYLGVLITEIGTAIILAIIVDAMLLSRMRKVNKR